VCRGAQAPDRPRGPPQAPHARQGGAAAQPEGRLAPSLPPSLPPSFFWASFSDVSSLVFSSLPLTLPNIPSLPPSLPPPPRTAWWTLCPRTPGPPPSSFHASNALSLFCSGLLTSLTRYVLLFSPSLPPSLPSSFYCCLHSSFSMCMLDQISPHTDLFPSLPPSPPSLPPPLPLS